MAAQAEGVVVVGAGGFGREALDIVEAMINHTRGMTLRGVVDDRPREADLERLSSRGIAYLGPAIIEVVGPSAALAVAVGSPTARRVLFERFAECRFPALIHPRAAVGSMVEIGEGVIICAGASVGTNVRLGRGCHLNPNSTIGHDTTLEEFVSVNPVANVSGDCVVGAGSLIGASAVVLQGRRIGRGATVGAGAVVVDDVPDASTVKGVPAR